MIRSAQYQLQVKIRFCVFAFSIAVSKPDNEIREVYSIRAFLNRNNIHNWFSLRKLAHAMYRDFFFFFLEEKLKISFEFFFFNVFAQTYTVGTVTRWF